MCQDESGEDEIIITEQKKQQQVDAGPTVHRLKRYAVNDFLSVWLQRAEDCSLTAGENLTSSVFCIFLFFD